MEISAKLQQDNCFDLTILSDVGKHTAQQYGLVFTLPKDVKELYKNLGADLPDLMVMTVINYQFLQLI